MPRKLTAPRRAATAGAQPVASPVSPIDANRLGVAWATIDRALEGARDGDSPSSAALLTWLSHWAPAGVVSLARVVGLTQSACTRALDKLEADGLVAREHVSGRDVRLTLTAAGRARARVLARRRQQALSGLLAALTEREQRQLAALLDRLVAPPVEDRAYAHHVCRFCDHAVCDGPVCPIGCRATALEAAVANAAPG